jgi:DNA-directed RNA polymerase subunit RPC12/RpoP
LAELRRLPWRCTKCGTNKVESSTMPMDTLQRTLDPTQMIGYCPKCSHKRMFRRESSD